jgi:predicted ABC-type transport system involved in lysophospholipase L1 biosynthesis ATPase subunit
VSGFVLQFRDVRKQYGGLRPLRVNHLEVGPAQALALAGFDAAMAEVFVNLSTGATLPDSGEVRAFGESTAAIQDADAWLASLDRFGIVSERAMVLDGLTALQNLAMPVTLDVDPLVDPARSRAARLAAEVGLDEHEGGRPVGELGPAARLRVRLGRALALDPLLLLVEHPTASLPAADLPSFASRFARIVAARGIGSITLSADGAFAAAAGHQLLTLQPATGELRPVQGWRRWFAGR